MTTLELITELEKYAGHSEVCRAALGFIQNTIGVCNSLPNGREILDAIASPKYFMDKHELSEYYKDRQSLV